MKLSNTIIFTMLAGLLLTNCKPKEGKDEDLPSPSVADFSYTKVVDPNDPNDQNTYVFQNTTPGGFISKWEFDTLGTSRSDSDTMFFAFEGTYDVKLTTSSEGGISTVTKQITIPGRSPYASQFTVTPYGSNSFIVTENALGTTDRTFHYENGDSSKAVKDTVYFPFAGSWDIALTVNTPKGTSTAIQTVTVAADDAANPDLNDQTVLWLTGGLGYNGDAGKVWVLDTTRKTGGVGPTSSLNTDWWNMPDGFHGSSWDDGMAQNEFRFRLRDYEYIPKNQFATIHFAYANKYFGKNQGQYADIALEDPYHKKAHFIVRKIAGSPGTGYVIDITDKSYIGYFEHIREKPQYRYRYQIINISDTKMYIRHFYDDNPSNDPANDGGARYFTLLKKAGQP